MKNKGKYFICMAINWTNWLLTMLMCIVLELLWKNSGSGSLEKYGMIVFGGNLLFAVFWLLRDFIRLSWFFQIFYFGGYIVAEIFMFMPEGIPFSTGIEANIMQKIILTILCIGIFASKIYTMSHKKAKYKEEPILERTNRRVESTERIDSGRATRKSTEQSSYEDVYSANLVKKQQQQAIYEINKKYKEGSAAIVKANNEVGAVMFSNKTNTELAQLRKQLEKEAELRGVKGKVSIY